MALAQNRFVRETHLADRNGQLDKVGVVHGQFPVHGVAILEEAVRDIARVDGEAHELEDEVASARQSSRKPLSALSRRPSRTLTASPFLILTFFLRTSGFIKQRSRVAMAMTAGIATKLNTLWHLRRQR